MGLIRLIRHISLIHVSIDRVTHHLAAARSRRPTADHRRKLSRSSAGHDDPDLIGPREFAVTLFAIMVARWYSCLNCVPSPPSSSYSLTGTPVFSNRNSRIESLANPLRSSVLTCSGQRTTIASHPKQKR